MTVKSWQHKRSRHDLEGGNKIDTSHWAGTDFERDLHVTANYRVIELLRKLLKQLVEHSVYTIGGTLCH